MATTFQATGSIGAGARYLFGSADDSYIVQYGVTVSSTNSNAILSVRPMQIQQGQQQPACEHRVDCGNRQR